jgi:hypothetical protein
VYDAQKKNAKCSLTSSSIPPPLLQFTPGSRRLIPWRENSTTFLFSLLHEKQKCHKANFGAHSSQGEWV